MRAFILILILVASAACVKGNPIDYGTFVGSGGTIEIANCGYAVTTQIGAQPPMPSTDVYGTDPTPMQIHLTLMADPKTSVVAQWRTNDETTLATNIRWAPGADLPADALTETEPGDEFGFRAGGSDGELHVYTIHQAHLCNLSPGTTYSYQVGGHNPYDDTDHWSDVFTFHTAPDITANPDAEVLLAFVGDSRGGYDIWQDLVTLIAARTPDLVMYSGDAITLGLSQYEWDDFFTTGQPLFATVPLIYAEGNHEVNAVNYFSQVALPGDQQNFGVDYGYAHITVANDSPANPDDVQGAVKDAIAADFAASAGAQWKLLMHHQPMWSASTMHGSNLMLQQLWQPLVDQYGIDLVLNGHDHDYEVSYPLNGQAVQATNATGTVYVVAGGAGAELYGNGMGFWTSYSEMTYSAAIIDVRRDQMTMNAFRQDGTPIPVGFSKSK
jgi:Purple acid Phosphatase, N-terminal domain/Calcineurin-like phosphoesterase